MKAIHKYPLTSLHPSLPVGARVLAMQEQNEITTLWCLVDPTNLLIRRRVCVVTTGESHEDGFWDTWEYIGTYQDGGFVGHVFMEKT
jgi:hypothetical protein